MALRGVSTALLALAFACSPARRIRIHPAESRNLRGLVFVPFASSGAEAFFDGEGHPCPPFSGKISDSFAGWHSADDFAVCDHDTREDSVHPARLELHWRGSVPANGSFDVLTGGYSVGAWGRVVARGSYYGDFFAVARVVLDVDSPHCRAEWSSQLALAKLTGSFTRAAEFSGWVEIPEIRIVNCSAGDPLDVRLQLVGESNRGKIEVDAFGLSAGSSSELDEIFGLRPAPPAPASPGTPPPAASSNR